VKIKTLHSVQRSIASTLWLVLILFFLPCKSAASDLYEGSAFQITTENRTSVLSFDTCLSAGSEYSWDADGSSEEEPDPVETFRQLSLIEERISQPLYAVVHLAPVMQEGHSWLSSQNDVSGPEFISIPHSDYFKGKESRRFLKKAETISLLYFCTPFYCGRAINAP
jgi:hypothetical protein